MTVSALSSDRARPDEHLGGLALVDNHVHGFWTSMDRTRFENGLNEANSEPLAAFDSGFDTQLGFAIRSHCAWLNSYRFTHIKRAPSKERSPMNQTSRRLRILNVDPT